MSASRPREPKRRSGRSYLRWPSRDFFAEIDPGGAAAHPVHELLHRAPEFRRLRRQIARLSTAIEPAAKSKRWLSLADKRGQLGEMELQAAFSIGFENGVILGRAEGLRAGARRSSEETRLATALRQQLVGAGVPAERATLVLIELAFALANGNPKGLR